MPRPTINDVAKLAGVSKTTVSHVLNQTRFVEPETSQRVLQVIAKLNYRPSSAARSLTTNRTHVIGMVVSDTSNQFFGDMLRGVEDVIGPQNYGLIVCNTDETLEREAHYLDLLLRQPVDGIIAAATSQRWGVLAEAESQHTPIVFVDRTFEGMDGPYVGVDNRNGAYLGTRHLIDCGYRRIGILAGFLRLSTMRERLAGFRQALEEAAIPLPPEWVLTSPLDIDAAYEAARLTLQLPHRPEALFLSNNFLSLGALRAVRDLGLDCPHDIALVGFDDHAWATVACPPLTVVRQPSRQVGQEAARLLFTLLKGEQDCSRQMLLNCELVVRQSTRPQAHA